MNDLEAELGLNDASDEDLARIKAALMAGQAPDSISEGSMDPMTVTGRGPVVQMPEEQIRGRSTMQMDPMEVRPRKTIKLDPMTIDPRAQVKIGDVKVSRSPSAVETGRPTTVATEPEEDQSTRLLNEILADDGRPTTVAEAPPAPTGDQLANALRRQNEAGPGMGITPERRAAQAALERSKARGQPMAEKVRTGPKLADDGSDTAPAPAAGGGGSGPMNWLGGVALGSAPQRTKQQEAQEALQRGLSSLNANRKASIAAFARNVESGMNTAYGTPNPRTAGTGLAEAGQANLRATLAEQQAKEGNRRAAAGEQATENQQAMAATQMNAGLAEKSRGMNLDAADRDPTSDPSRQARMMAVSLYPKETGRIPPDEFKKMSKKDIQMFFGEAQQFRPQATGGGAGGLKASDMLKWNQRLGSVKGAKSMEDALDSIDQGAAAAGGWEKVGGVGYLAGFQPNAMLDAPSQRMRQEVQALVNDYAHGKFGSALSAHEKQRSDAAISAIQGAKTVQEIQNGLKILRESNHSNVKQALAGAPPEVLAAFKGDLGGDRTDVLAKPSGGSAKPGGGKVRVSNGKQSFDVDAADVAAAEADGFKRATSP